MTSASAATFSTEVPFADLHDDFLRLTTEIGWCSVATVDGKGRPRTRILHVSWETGDGAPVGWVSTSRSPVKTAHLARNPYVSCGYWTPAHDAVFADCRARWAEDDASRRHAWTLVAAEARERGFDPYAVWRDGANDSDFNVLRLDPWRIQITLADLARGETVASSRVWHAPA
ncbi:pyridoxamine 5'-phosphate oxidase family protein [Actinomadura miaoliensis]|uniref:Pyridoxamine 5'-phosphate oxidase family protein n=1 Tax=Actinomadura miaoliensis TaxID=430685 RepID=A0ABP7WAD1_9ACTN